MRLLPSIAVALTTAAALTACGSKTTTHSPPAQASHAPSNPVDILKKIEGCKLPAGTTSGELDLNGNRYASCTYTVKLDNGTSYDNDVEVRTYSGAPATADPEGWPPTPQDDKWWLAGPDWTLMVSGAPVGLAKVDLQKILTETGGTPPPGQVTPHRAAPTTAAPKTSAPPPPPTTATTSAAAQTTPDCVTQEEFDSVDTGASRQEVEQAFGVGALAQGSTPDDQTYMTCDHGHAALMSFDPTGHLLSKEWTAAG